MKLAAFAAPLLLGAAAAAAQPIDPYADPPQPAPQPVPQPQPVPLPPIAPSRLPVVALPGDVDLDEAVAGGLLARARVLAAEGAFADARQLVLEAIARRPDGPVHAEATALLAELNGKLGIVDAPPPPPPPPVEPPTEVRPRPVLDLYDEPPPADAPPAAARSRFIASGVVWGAVAGGLFADVVSGLDDTETSDVAVGAALGALGGGIAGAALRRGDLTAGDAALIDSVALWGTEAATALAFAIAPPETEAYTLNATLGAVGGYLIGHIAARGQEVSASRLWKVDAIATAGAAAPWLLYALVNDSTVDDDEQAFGWLSMAGLGAGIYFGFRWTSDGPDRHTDDAPAALVRRSSRGGWSMGGPALAPVRPSAAGERGVAVTVLGGAW